MRTKAWIYIVLHNFSGSAVYRTSFTLHLSSHTDRIQVLSGHVVTVGKRGPNKWHDPQITLVTELKLTHFLRLTGCFSVARHRVKLVACDLCCSCLSLLWEAPASTGLCWLGEGPWISLSYCCFASLPFVLTSVSSLGTASLLGNIDTIS